MPPYDMSLNVFDEESAGNGMHYEIKLSYERLRVDGEHFGYPKNTMCYLPIFPHGKDIES